MALLEIVKNPAKVLETKAAPVSKFDAELAKLLDDMYDTMLEHDGVGIAAPQVNKSIQAAVVEMGEERAILEIINPTILATDGSAIEIEGCLSFPELYGDVERPDYVHIKAQDRNGEWYEVEAAGFDARVIQHEIDHLFGVLFDKKITRVYTLEELDEMAEAEEEQE